jgi:hypothetical protein
VDGSADTVGVVPPRGSVVIYCEAKRGRTVQRIERALTSNDRKELAAVATDVAESLKGKSDPPRRDVIDMMRDVETVFDVRYHGKTIIDANGLLPGYKFSTATIAYTGGSLQHDGFVIAEYLRHEGSPGYDYLVAIRRPVLTDLERAALESLPSELSEMTIGGNVDDDDYVEEDTFKVVADAAREMVEREMTSWHKPDILEHLEEELQAGRITPTESAAALMRARQELLIRSQQK